jgi:hypothetical protein
MLETVEALWARHVQGAQDHGIQSAENYGVGTDGQRERCYGNNREARRLTQDPNTEARVLDEDLEEIAGYGFAAFLFESFTAAEFDACAPFRLGSIKAGAFEVVSTVLDVRTKLLIHVVFNARALDDASD